MKPPRYYQFDYEIRSAEGDVVDTSEGGVPLWFVEGDGRVMPGLEAALAGREAGDEFSVVIPPEQAYGLPQRALIRTLAPEMIGADVEEIEAGMIFQVGSGEHHEVVRVTAVEKDGITVDANHPLAGVTFRFVIRVLVARDATRDEVELLGKP